MTYRIVYSPRSQRDLEKIGAWITGESQNPALAARFLEGIFEACDSLKTLPNRFTSYPYARRWRMMPFSSYLVFFQIHEDQVRVGHIRHGARMPFRG